MLSPTTSDGGDGDSAGAGAAAARVATTQTDSADVRGSDHDADADSASEVDSASEAGSDGADRAAGGGNAAAPWRPGVCAPLPWERTGAAAASRVLVAWVPEARELCGSEQCGGGAGKQGKQAMLFADAADGAASAGAGGAGGTGGASGAGPAAASGQALKRPFRQAMRGDAGTPSQPCCAPQATAARAAHAQPCASRRGQPRLRQLLILPAGAGSMLSLTVAVTPFDEQAGDNVRGASPGAASPNTRMRSLSLAAVNPLHSYDFAAPSGCYDAPVSPAAAAAAASSARVDGAAVAPERAARDRDGVVTGALLANSCLSSGEAVTQEVVSWPGGAVSPTVARTASMPDADSTEWQHMLMAASGQVTLCGAEQRISLCPVQRVAAPSACQFAHRRDSHAPLALPPVAFVATSVHECLPVASALAVVPPSVPASADRAAGPQVLTVAAADSGALWRVETRLRAFAGPPLALRSPVAALHAVGQHRVLVASAVGTQDIEVHTAAAQSGSKSELCAAAPSAPGRCVAAGALRDAGAWELRDADDDAASCAHLEMRESGTTAWTAPPGQRVLAAAGADHAVVVLTVGAGVAQSREAAESVHDGGGAAARGADAAAWLHLVTSDGTSVMPAPAGASSVAIATQLPDSGYAASAIWAVATWQGVVLLITASEASDVAQCCAPSAYDFATAARSVTGQPHDSATDGADCSAVDTSAEWSVPREGTGTQAESLVVLLPQYDARPGAADADAERVSSVVLIGTRCGALIVLLERSAGGDADVPAAENASFRGSWRCGLAAGQCWCKLLRRPRASCARWRAATSWRRSRCA